MDVKVDKEAPDAWRMTESLRAEQGKGDPFAAAIRATRMSMLITDPRQSDNPIVFVNDAFLKLTGYERHEVLGQNCRFLQGERTNRESIEEIRQAIADGVDVSIDVLNYRKDGTPFWNALFISPVYNEGGVLQFFFASQLDVSDRKQTEHLVHEEKDRFEEAIRQRTRELEAAVEAKTVLLHEVDHRVKNNLQMISSLLLMQSREISDPEIRKSLQGMLKRIEALSTVHRRLFQSDNVTRFDVADFVRDLVSDMVGLFGEDRITVEFDLEPLSLPADKAAPVALMINELITNSLKHAFPEDSTSARAMTIRMRDEADNFLIEISDNGVGLSDADADEKSFGARMIRSLAKQLDATVDWQDAMPGTRISLRLPAEVIANQYDRSVA